MSFEKTVLLHQPGQEKHLADNQLEVDNMVVAIPNWIH